MRNTRVRWIAIPLHNDGREMMGTHGSVSTPDGRTGVLAHVVWGEYVSAANMVRFAVRPYGSPGVRYGIFRWPTGGHAPRKVMEFTVPSTTRKG